MEAPETKQPDAFTRYWGGQLAAGKIDDGLFRELTGLSESERVGRLGDLSKTGRITNEQTVEAARVIAQSRVMEPGPRTMTQQDYDSLEPEKSGEVRVAPEPDKPAEQEPRPVPHRGEPGYEDLVALLDDPSVPDDVKKLTEAHLKARYPSPGEARKALENLPTVREWLEKRTAEKAAESEGEKQEREKAAEKALEDLAEEGASQALTPEALRAALEKAGVPPDQIEAAVARMQAPEAKAKLETGILYQFKNYVSQRWKETLAGGAAGYGIKTYTRAALATVFASLGLGTAAGLAAGTLAGGIGGAAVGGARAYWQERKKVAGKSVLERLAEISGAGEEEIVNCDWNKRAAIYARVKDAYDKSLITGEQAEIARVGEALRAAKVLMDRDAGKISEKPQKDRVLALIKIAEDAKAEIPLTNGEDKKLLLSVLAFDKKQVQLERGPVDRKKILAGIKRGAVWGLVGGIIGSGLSWMIHGSDAVQGAVGQHGLEQVGSVPPSGGGGGFAVIGELPHAGGPADILAHGGATEAVTHAGHEAATAVVPPPDLSEHVVGIHNAYSEAAHAAILNHDYTATVHPGDGPTHVARNLVHDYLVNLHHTDPGAPMPKPEQLVWLEDSIQREISERTLQLGHEPFHMTGAHIAEWYGKALNLSPEKIQNLHQFVKMPGGPLSSKTLEYFHDFDHLKEASNNFFTDAQSHAEAAQRAYIEHLQSVAHAGAEHAGAAGAVAGDHIPPGGISEAPPPAPLPHEAIPGAPTNEVTSGGAAPEEGVWHAIFGSTDSKLFAGGAAVGAAAMGGYAIYRRRISGSAEQTNPQGDKAEENEEKKKGAAEGEGGDEEKKHEEDETGSESPEEKKREAEIAELFKSSPKLGEIYERASRKDASFGKELTLSEEEISAIRTLAGETRDNWQSKYIEAALKGAGVQDAWNSFVGLFEDNPPGITDEQKALLADNKFELVPNPASNNVAPLRIENGKLRIMAPPALKELYEEYLAMWQDTDSLTKDLEIYDEKVSGGAKSNDFAERLKSAYRFNEKFKV